VRAEETVDGDLRYQMLEMIRAYAIERLETSGEEPATRAAHLGYFTRWSEGTATGLKDLDRPTSLDLFQTEFANIHAALEWACVAGRQVEGLTLAGHVWKFWQFRAHFSEGRSWLQRLLDATPDEPTADRAVGFEAAGVLAWNQGDLPAAEGLLERALAINLERGDELGRGRCLNNLGNVHNLMGNLDSAAALFRESLELARSMGNSQQEATLLNNLALVEMDRGALDAAQTLLEESLALKQRLGVRSETSIVLGNLALVAWLRRDLGQATELLEEGLEIERETGNPVGIADALGNLAQVLVEAGDLPRALSLHRESLILRRDIGDWLSIPYSLESIGAAAVGAGIVAPSSSPPRRKRCPAPGNRGANTTD
jgi:tetratricopeptide (TPR) repeat protein